MNSQYRRQPGYGRQQRQMVRAEPMTEAQLKEIQRMFIPDITPFRIGLFATWIIGILMMNYASAPYTPPFEDLERYDQLTAQADTMLVAINAEKDYWMAAREMENERGFFYNGPTYESKRRYFEEKKAIYLHENAKRQALRDEANQLVGIWSEYGLQAARNSFWEAYERGKAFAKRMTWWDVMFSAFGGRGSRDENMIAIMLQWVLRIAMNFTLGFMYSLFSFLWGLFWVIADFSPNMASATTFYLCGAIASISMVASILIAMYGTIATVVVGGTYVAIQNQQLEGGSAAQRQRLHQE